MHRREFRQLSDYGDRKGSRWRRAASGYDVFDSDSDSGHCPSRCTTVYRDRYVTIAERARS